MYVIRDRSQWTHWLTVCTLNIGNYPGPGDFLEVRKILPLLTANTGDHPSFHVVAPSLPGFGFSEGAKKPGFAGRQYAEVPRLPGHSHEMLI